MRVRPIETATQFVSDPKASAAWEARLLGIEPTPYPAPHVTFDEHCERPWSAAGRRRP
ncbi:MAG: hypothetical protein HY294_03015 [Candidatus Rokubacteria bacterium]|nr:hypothetical protein [Candidatus Rokubacteria bacterium]